MTNQKPTAPKDFAYMVRKYLISAFVVASFAAYALHDKSSDPNGASGLVVPPQGAAQDAQTAQNQQAAPVVTISPTSTSGSQAVTAVPTASSTAAPIGPIAPTRTPVQNALKQATPTHPVQPSPTAPPVPTPTAITVATGYKDGQYMGKVANAYYGNLQVKVVIQNGRIVDIQFVDYPHDRRRSQMINDQVMPWLHDEAISVQNAQVDVISGATLTSQAFIQSVQSALDTAKAKA